MPKKNLLEQIDSEIDLETIETSEEINLSEESDLRAKAPLDIPDLLNDKLELHKKDDKVHVIHPCWFKVSGTLSVATNVDLSWIAPLPLNIEEVYAYVRTAPTGATLNIDINKNGTSILASALSVAISANTASTKAIRIPGQPHLNINDRLDIDVDQVGSTQAGANLSVFVRFKLV